MDLKGFLNKIVGTKQNALTPNAQVAVGGFEAAAFSRDRSVIYHGNEGNYAQQDTYGRQELVSLTRYLVNNYPLFERILTVAEIYGVGNGIIANATTSDDAFNTLNTEVFDTWACSPFCSSNQQYNFYEMQKLIVRELLIAGEVFILLVKSGSGYPQLMLVNSESVRHTGKPGDDSINGLYVDDFGKVTAYNVFTGNGFQKVDASNVIHLMRHKQIGQLRGVSAFAASLNAARDHKDCLILEKKAIKVHAALAAVVQRKEGSGNTSGAFGNIAPQAAPEGTSRSNVGLERAFSGAVVYADKDEDIKLLTSERSTQGFLNFLEMLLRDVCLNLSIPYEFLVNAEKLSGTGVRFALGDAAFFFNSLQTMLIDGALTRIYSWVTASNIKDGKIAAPVDGLPWNVAWTKPISITIDQQRMSNVEISLLQNSLLTYEAYYSARGKNWQHELRQRAYEERFLNELSVETGISIARLKALPAGAPAMPDTQPTEANQAA